MPIQMSRRKASRQHGLNLRPKFYFQFGELGLSQQFGDAVIAVEETSLINQGRNPLAGGERAPPIQRHIADDGQMYPEGNLGVVWQYLHGMERPRAWNHQGRRTDHAIRERTQNTGVATVGSPEVIGVD